VFNSPNGISPRLMLLGPCSRLGNAGNIPTGTPNVNIHHDLTRLSIFTEVFFWARPEQREALRDKERPRRDRAARGDLHPC
jgi:hypothetical protein